MNHLLRHFSRPTFGIRINSVCVQQHVFSLPFRSSQLRTFFTGKDLSANYEGDGRTVVTILNKQHKHILMINSYSTVGFRLNNGIFVAGPIAIFPKTVLFWNVNAASDISPENLSLFALLEPKLDILVLGTGDSRVAMSSEVEHLFKSKKISAEILPTDQACNIFNFLIVEGRCVAGAFIPPTVVNPYEEELHRIQGGVSADLDVFR